MAIDNLYSVYNLLYGNVIDLAVTDHPIVILKTFALYKTHKCNAFRYI